IQRWKIPARNGPDLGGKVMLIQLKLGSAFVLALSRRWSNGRPAERYRGAAQVEERLFAVFVLVQRGASIRSRYDVVIAQRDGCG
ncbi:MAG: hypothetical protein AAFP17_17635, partial [Pseudomonadota bacterium]